MNPRALPPTASLASAERHGRLNAAAAERNAAAVIRMVRDVVPATGRALEIASGTGQHIVQLAAALPELIWQPSDVDPARLVSIAAWSADSPLANLRPACRLDATAPGWAEAHTAQDVILLVNLLHLISGDEAQTLIDESAKALAFGGIIILYGPFMRSGVLTSAGDLAFHASLRNTNQQLGYKNDMAVLDMLKAARLTSLEPVEMPANNLALMARKF